MKILLSASSYPKNYADWRSVFIRHMATALAKRSDIDLSIYAPPGELPPKVLNLVPDQDRAWLSKLMDKGGVAHLLRNHLLQGLYWGGRLSAGFYRAYQTHGNQQDLLHVNWLQSALFIPKKVTPPLLVTVLGSDMGLLKYPAITTRLRKVFQQRKTIIAPNADWMEPHLLKLFGDIAQISTVAFGIDTEWFEVNRQPNQSTPKWLTIARLTRKKLGPLLEWGESVFSDKHQLHLIGPMQEPIQLPGWVHYHGPSDPTRLRTQWLPNAMGLVTLSEHDEGRPQIMLEAMAAGLPMVVSPLAAHTELVKHGETGFVVHSAQEFREAILNLDNLAANVEMGKAAREKAKQQFGTWDDCAKRYVSLYHQLSASR